MQSARVTAIMLMAAGLGWMAGNFVQPGHPLGVHIFTTLIHALPVALTVLFAVPLFRGGIAAGPRWARNGITTVAAVYLLGTIVILLYSLHNPDPNAFGIHSLPDAEATSVFDAGSILWLALLRRTTA